MNQVLITLDSCRYDTFKNTKLSFMKSGKWARCYTHGTWTLPAHEAFFMGKLPCNFDKGIFDTEAGSRRWNLISPNRWRLNNGPESYKNTHLSLSGRNIKHGFQNAGFTTIGTGAMNWFKPEYQSTYNLLADFDHYKYFPSKFKDGRNFEKQCKWAIEISSALDKSFIFINAGETHHKYQAHGHQLWADYGNKDGCMEAQSASLQWIDSILTTNFNSLTGWEIIICGDHGDCWGEDELWGHSFCHPKVMAVPMAFIKL